MTGAEVIENFQPSEDIKIVETEIPEAIRQALQYLFQTLQIIKFNQEETPDQWIFRSRIAEIIRLLTKLRQRIVTTNNRKESHRLSQCKRLVADVKFTVASRRVPRRNLELNQYLNILTQGNQEHKQVVNILTETINLLANNRNIDNFKLSGFQQRTFEKVLQGIELEKQTGIDKGVVVTASTGAGKTYAFFMPILAKMILERCLRGKVGVKAICIYPRVALSENQLTDFIEILFYLNQVLAKYQLPPLKIGLESGASVYQIKDFQVTTDKQKDKLSKMRGWTFDNNYGGYLSPFAYCVGTENKACNAEKQRLIAYPTNPENLICPACNKQYSFIQFARDKMQEHPPDLLIATTESLHRRLLSSKYQYLFGTDKFSAPSVIMLDEIHLQTSTAGTQVALLLRRLIARIKLGKKVRNELANLVFVGLSATIAEPKDFLSSLSGIATTKISHVSPNEEEMQTIGAERYIFVRAEENEDTAVISTLIQTAMAVLHNMSQPSQGKYRTFGFVQSLDLVGRWLYQMEDAEKVKDFQITKREQEKNKSIQERNISYLPLYAYRFPPFNRQLFPNFLGKNFQCNCNCENNGQPDLNCPYFQSGECWWALSQKDKARREPLKIKRKSGSDRSVTIDTEDDLVITTSALEVGYDDEDLMCVIQYQSPSNVASFVQRKGRGGRKVGTRPIIVTVLSPYKANDLFLFRNEHLLTDPTFKKLPLNPQNRYLQRIHGFYTFFDWLAYHAHCQNINLDLEELRLQGYEYLKEQTINLEVLLAFKDYLQQTFDITDNAIAEVLGDKSKPDGLLWKIFYQGLMTQVFKQFETKNSAFIKARNLLTKYLPDNLFSDINLPEVRVDYRPNLNLT
jgi:hypothetical protein